MNTKSHLLSQFFYDKTMILPEDIESPFVQSRSRSCVNLVICTLTTAGAVGYIAPMAQIYCTCSAVILCLGAQLYCPRARAVMGSLAGERPRNIRVPEGRQQVARGDAASAAEPRVKGGDI